MAATTHVNPPPRELRRLVHEIERYLAAVDVFRAEGREPRWAPEQATGAVVAPSLSQTERKEER